MLGAEVEGEALALYREAGMDPAEPEGVKALARRLLGAGALVERAALAVPAKYVRTRGEVWIRRGLSARAAGFLVAHELAEWHLERLRYRGEWRERLCDSLAAALVCPREAFLFFLGEKGRSLPALAAAFTTTQSVAALRLGEVTGSPLALVTSRSVLVRGEAWEWPPERELRLLAREGAPLCRGLDRVPVTDAPRRVVLAAA